MFLGQILRGGLSGPENYTFLSHHRHTVKITTPLQTVPPCLVMQFEHCIKVPSSGDELGLNSSLHFLCPALPPASGATQREKGLCLTLPT